MHLLKPQVLSRFSRQSPAGTVKRLPPMFALVFKAYLQLVRFDLLLARGNFEKLYEKVRTCRRARVAAVPGVVEKTCAAIDLASIWYWKQVLCLQRSAVPAQMVIGIQQMPFKAHAWVEAGGHVVGDKPYMQEMYRVLDRC
jgi:Transglutaminase-like superfamily